MIFGKLIGVERVALIHEIWGCYHRKERRKSFGLKSRMNGIMHLTRSYHWSKVSLERIVEDGALGNLAAAGDREESASHHYTGMKGYYWAGEIAGPDPRKLGALPIA